MKTLEICSNPNAEWDEVIERIERQIDSFKGQKKKDDYSIVIELIQSNLDLKLFVFSLKLYSIKDMLLAEAKLKKAIISERLAKLHPLSLEYDKLSVLNPYSTRVNGALLALFFFEKLEAGISDFMSADVEQFLKVLSNDALSLKSQGVEPNQIFMLMFNESINQSIISDSGTNYEDRILSVLIDGFSLEKQQISKTHDKEDASTEYDFFFRLDDDRSYGIGAKRTLRERYKQFIKTAHTSEIDVMIEITIGLDLNQAKAQTIRTHGVYIFVADEVYDNRDDLINLSGVFPVRELTKETLLSLI
ncbi:MAG: hypothetical protein WAX77_15010 [Methylococcaceae bacterium]